MTLTPEQERDFETVFQCEGHELPSAVFAALSRLRSELEAAREMHDSAVAKAIENANEVERLREALKRIADADHTRIGWAADSEDIARQALSPTKEGE